MKATEITRCCAPKMGAEEELSLLADYGGGAPDLILADKEKP